MIAGDQNVLYTAIAAIAMAKAPWLPERGLEQTEWGVSPREPKFHRIPNWTRLDHRHSCSTVGGGGGTKKGDRGYIRLIPR